MPEVRYGKCPECGGKILISEDAKEGEVVNCPDCATESVIKKIKNKEAELEPLNIEGEDWGE